MSKNQNQRYNDFLQGVCTAVAKFRPESIAAILMMPDGVTMTCYFDCDSYRKAVAASVLQQDAIMERIGDNPDWLREVMDRDQPDGNGRYEF